MKPQHPLRMRLQALAMLEQRRHLSDPQWLALYPLLEQLVAQQRSQSAHTIELLYSTLWLPTQIYGQRSLLAQALTHLLDNARAFSDPHLARITVSVQELARHWQIQVQDNGCGIPPAALAHLGELFYALPRHDGRRGHGLGLAFTQQIARLHAGHLQLRNHQPTGVVATLQLAKTHTIHTQRASPAHISLRHWN